MATATRIRKTHRRRRKKEQAQRHAAACPVCRQRPGNLPTHRLPPELAGVPAQELAAVAHQQPAVKLCSPCSRRLFAGAFSAEELDQLEKACA